MGGKIRKAAVSHLQASGSVVTAGTFISRDLISKFHNNTRKHPEWLLQAPNFHLCLRTRSVIIDINAGRIVAL